MVVGYHHFRKPPIFCYFHGNAVYFTYEKRDERCFETKILWPEVQRWYTWPCQIQAICPSGGKNHDVETTRSWGWFQPPIGAATPKTLQAFEDCTQYYVYIYTRIYRMYNRFCYLNIGMFLAWFPVEVSNILDFSSFSLHFFQRQDPRGFLSKHRRT